MGQYGPDEFKVLNNGGGMVDAKFLKDDYGNYIIDKSTNIPYVVPADFNPHEAMDQFHSMRIANSTNPLAEAVIYDRLYSDFHAAWPGSNFDLQRTYNGYHGAGANDFVKAFTPAASWYYGLAVAAAGLTDTEALIGGGAQNLISSRNNASVDTSGAFYNAADNVSRILSGYDGYTGGNTIVAIDSPDEVFNRTVKVDNTTWQIEAKIWDKYADSETMVQVGTNQNGEKTVSIQTEEWGVVFGEDNPNDYWNNQTELPPQEVYDYYDYDTSYYGYGYSMSFRGDTGSSGSNAPAENATGGKRDTHGLNATPLAPTSHLWSNDSEARSLIAAVSAFAPAAGVQNTALQKTQAHSIVPEYAAA